MTEDAYRNIKMLLAGNNPEELSKGLSLAEKEIAKTGSQSAKPLFEVISTLFYIDTLDHPELAPIVDKAVHLMARFGSPVIPILMATLDEGDLKAVCHRIMGTDESYDWDRAYIVRKEAEEALEYFSTHIPGR
jgi:hypothetical protein